MRNCRAPITTGPSRDRTWPRRRGARSFSRSGSIQSDLATLYAFWITQQGGVTAFCFYNPFDVPTGAQIGSNYDPSGNNLQGRITVVFRGNWAQATDLARSNVQALQLVEVA